MRRVTECGLVGVVARSIGALVGCGDDAGGAGGDTGVASAGGSGSGGNPGTVGSGGGTAGGSGGSDTGAGATAESGAVTGTGGGLASDTTLFSPDIPRNYVGSVVEPGMDIIAFTIREDEPYYGAVWLAAIKNTQTDRLCAINMNVTFLDARSGSQGLCDSLCPPC